MKKAWIIALAAIVLRLGFAQDLSARERKYYQTLDRVSLFAFGRIGYSGVTSTGEWAYRKLLRSPRAATAFQALLRDSTATMPAKLYALHGLRAQAPSLFAEAVIPFLSHEGRVTTMSGCRLSEATVSEIARGYY